MRYRFAIACMILAGSAFGGNFDPKAYKPDSFAHVYESAIAVGGADYSFEGSIVKNRVEVIFTGQHRELSADTKGFLKKWAASFHHPREYGEMFTYEIEVKDKDTGRVHWLPLQDALVQAFGTEIEDGGRVELFVMYLGAHKGNKVFIVNEFLRK